MRLAAWPPGACGAPSSAPPPRAWSLKMDDQPPCAAGRRGAPWFECASLRCAGPSGDVRRGRGPRARALWRSVCEALPVLQVGVRVLGRLRSVLALRGPGTRAARERLLPAAGRPSLAGGSFAAGASPCRDGPSVSSLAAPARGATSNTALPRATPESLLPAFASRSPVVSRPTVTPLMQPEFTFVPFAYLNVFR